jgi:hypothetical protein
MNDLPPFTTMRKAALVMVWVGALCSLALTFYVGRHNRSIFLISLFLLWVLLPFALLLIADLLSTRWSRKFRVSLYILMLLLSIGAPISYMSALGQAANKPAALFLLVPLGSLTVTGVFVWVAGLLSPKRSRNLPNTDNSVSDPRRF